MREGGKPMWVCAVKDVLWAKWWTSPEKLARTVCWKMRGKRLSPAPVGRPPLRVGSPRASHFPNFQAAGLQVQWAPAASQKLLDGKPKRCEMLWAHEVTHWPLSGAATTDIKSGFEDRERASEVQAAAALSGFALRSCRSADSRTFLSNGWVWFQLVFNFQRKAFQQH